MSRTSSGMSIHRSWLTSCKIKSMGNIGVRSCGPIGCFVAGWSGGLGLFGISAMMLYHLVGISLSERRILVCLMHPPQSIIVLLHMRQHSAIVYYFADFLNDIFVRSAGENAL